LHGPFPFLENFSIGIHLPASHLHNALAGGTARAKDRAMLDCIESSLVQ
jgi:hypothetical protein